MLLLVQSNSIIS